MRLLVLAGGCLVTLLLGGGNVARAQSAAITILHSFADGITPSDAAYCDAPLILGADGNYYGTTTAGGPSGGGAVFRVTPQGSETVLHFFDDGTVTNDGTRPCAGLIQGLDGNFYGTTIYGGSRNGGTVFRITPSGTLTILHSFLDGTVADDGWQPIGGLVQASDGTFYGTTYSGGSAGCGTVFQMTAGGTVSILHSFGDESVANDGQYPSAGLLLTSSGNLYGVTPYGGAAGEGAIFQITASGAVTILHSFGDGSIANDAEYPVAPLIEATDGNLYGTSFGGGSATAGTVFRITAAGALTVLHSFLDGSVTNDGAYPSVSLFQGPDDAFYGTTERGGSASGGAVFRITMEGDATILHSFRDGSVPGDGRGPQASLILGSDENFYGTTYYGGSSDGGAVFEVTSAGSVTIVHSFADGSVPNDGTSPTSALIQGPDGDFYGTTQGGGSADQGSVFQVTQDGYVTITHSFGDGTVSNDGAAPASALILGTDGNFYGTTADGGSNGVGTVYQITPGGAVTILHSFKDGTVTNDGSTPSGGLIQGLDGDFYGTTTVGGSASHGTVFRITSTGTITILHSFGDGSVIKDGEDPDDALIQDSNGNFYGMTSAGGAANFGTVFRINSAGGVTILHSFGDGSVPNDGKYINAGLILGSDGNFYGTTYEGGSANAGTVFRMTAAGAVTILHSFGDGSVAGDGEYPFFGTLLQGLDGSFYGTATEGGTMDYGAVYRITPLGAVTILHSCNDGSVANDGTFPVGGLIQGSNGELYGVSQYGGGFEGFGTVYDVILPTPTPTITPAGGLVPMGQQVTISDALIGATIYYTTDGSTPSPGQGTTQPYSTAIAVTRSETINAIATATGYLTSGVRSATYTIEAAAATPRFSPNAGSYVASVNVTISDMTPNATIYYTTDGSTPSVTSGAPQGTTQTYSAPFNLTRSATVNAIAIATGYSTSAVGTISYSVTPRTVLAVATTCSPCTDAVVPIAIQSSGTENTVSATLTFDPTVLTYVSASAGPADSTVAPVMNTTGAATGSVGFTITVPSSGALPTGLDQILNVTFSVASGASAGNTAIGFAGTPVAESVLDASSNSLTATFTGANVSVVTEWEGDVLLQGSVGLQDWVYIGEIVVGLAPQPTSGPAYQAADCAPCGDPSDGPIGLQDWAQVGRYVVGLDPPTPLGGPTAPD